MVFLPEAGVDVRHVASCPAGRARRMPRRSPSSTRRSRRSPGTSPRCSPATSWPSSRARRRVAAGLADALDAVRVVARSRRRHDRRRAGCSPRPCTRAAPARSSWRRTDASVSRANCCPRWLEASDLPRSACRRRARPRRSHRARGREGRRPVARRTFPAATQDLSLVSRREFPPAPCARPSSRAPGELLESRAPRRRLPRRRVVPDGSKCLTFALRFRAPDRTLTAAEATEAKLAGVGMASTRFGATLRE